MARGQVREIDFTTDEGTWMSVDISPDGQWIVFDLLAHIYRVPVGGGEAECLTQSSGVAVNYHPSFSPDGRHIAFISDRGGQDNLWIMNADGTDPRPVLLDPRTRMSEPAWTPDGKHLLVTRAFQRRGFLRYNPRIWSIPVDGGEGFEVTGGDSWHAHDASASPDGRWVYFHRSADAAGTSPLGTLNHVERVDVHTGRVEDVTQTRPEESVTGTFAPQISPDGTRLAFARRLPLASLSYRGHEFRPRPALWVRNLSTGVERVVLDPLDLDNSGYHAHKRVGVLPGYSWARDGRSIVISQGGRIRRLRLESGDVETIPFTARVRRTISEAPHARIEITEEFDARFLRWPASSPDGSRLVFEAVGRLWTMDLPDGTPGPLTDGSDGALELTPAWSPDGQWLAFTTWDDATGGHVWKMPADGGAPERLTTVAGAYLYPEWGPDGRWVVATRGTGLWTDRLWDELVRIPTAGGAAEVVVGTGTPHQFSRSPWSFAPWSDTHLRATFGSDGRIYYPERIDEWGEDLALRSVGPDGSDPRTHFLADDGDDLVPSPDLRRLAVWWSDVSLSGFPADSDADPPIYIYDAWDAGTLSLERLSLDGGLYPRWRNATTLEFVSGNRYVTYDAISGRMDTVHVDLRVARDAPAGRLALTGARIVTLDERDVIERGTLLVEGDRIACVGDCDTTRVDRVLDVRGKTIIPGLVDVHAHGLARVSLIPQRRHHSARYLAYGVTSIREVTGDPRTAFPVAERTAGGRMVGPRTFTVGHALRWWLSPDTYLETEQHVSRLASWGAVALKDYMLSRREQRQWLAEAARRRALTLTAEPWGLFYVLGLVMDGHTGWEHDLTATPIYHDVVQFFARSGAVWSPTLSILPSNGTERAQSYFLARSDLRNDPKERRFVPWWDLLPARNTSRRPLEEYAFPLVAQGVADILRAGGHAAIGGHGEHPGLDSHWEVWTYASALKPIEALEMASLGGAYALGLDHELGSIEVGKLADLIILNSNPLDDIENTLDIVYVMKGGRLYDDDTLDEIWPTPRPYGPYPWSSPDWFRADDRSLDHWERERR